MMALVNSATSINVVRKNWHLLKVVLKKEAPFKKVVSAKYAPSSKVAKHAPFVKLACEKTACLRKICSGKIRHLRKGHPKKTYEVF